MDSYAVFDRAYFQNQTDGELSLQEVIASIKKFLEEDKDATYSLIIGTDSHERSTGKKGAREANLITAIVVHRKGFGGRYFWNSKKVTNIHSLRQKIYAETYLSLNFASVFVPLLAKGLNGTAVQYDLEIHVDVGEHGETREMIKEIVGMVTGNGYVAKTKPESFAASYVADRHT